MEHPNTFRVSVPRIIRPYGVRTTGRFRCGLSEVGKRRTRRASPDLLIDAQRQGPDVYFHIRIREQLNKALRSVNRFYFECGPEADFV